MPSVAKNAVMLFATFAPVAVNAPENQSGCATLVPLVIPTAVKRASACISSRAGRRDLAFVFILRVG